VAESQSIALPPLEERPLVTFALFAYNQEKYIREAVEGAFAQTYEPLEIILSDDCSTDRTFEIMREMAAGYRGPHRIVLNKNSTNQGLCRHVNTVFRLAKADVIVMAAGDDISLSGRVAHTVEIFHRHPDVLSVSMEYRSIDERGLLGPRGKSHFHDGKFNLRDLLERVRMPIHGSTRAYRKHLFEIFGPLHDSCKIEDATLRLRALLAGCIYHSDVQGILYRVHSASLSASIKKESQLSVYRQYLLDLKRAVSLSMFGPDQSAQIKFVLRSMIARGLILSRHHQARYRLLSFLSSVLPSARFSGREKIYLFYEILSCSPLAPVVKIIRKGFR